MGNVTAGSMVDVLVVKLASKAVVMMVVLMVVLLGTYWVEC